MDYFNWLFFEMHTSTQINISLQKYFKQLTLDITENFKKTMWENGKNRLAIGLIVKVKHKERTITYLDKNYFYDENGTPFEYHLITDIVTIPQVPKFSNKNIKIGMQLRLKNKKYTGNIYTVTKVYKNGFDAKNGKYDFELLAYDSIAKIVLK